MTCSEVLPELKNSVHLLLLISIGIHEISRFRGFNHCRYPRCLWSPLTGSSSGCQELFPLRTHQLVVNQGIPGSDQPQVLANLSHLPENSIDSQSTSLISPSPYQSPATPGQYAVATVHAHALRRSSGSNGLH
jgi:hypothetical protein